MDGPHGGNLNMTDDSRQVAKVWAGRAAELAAWAWQGLVNRTDAWGGYHSLTDRERIVTRPDGTKGPLGSTTTRPARAKPRRVFWTPSVREGHFRATVPQYVVGLHTTSPANTCRWGAVEVDHHGESSTPPDINFAAARAWHARLLSLGFHPLLTDSNGKGGFHLLTIFSRPVPSATVFAFLRWLSDDYAALGLDSRPETFPKQPRIAEGRYGNWLRLPGRHHTRPFWSRVWDCDRWLEGARAVEFILALQGDSPA